MGSYGGFIAGSKELTDSIREKSAIYQASTALPPPIVAASLASLKIMRENPELRVQLLDKSLALRNEIIGLGYTTTQAITPIIPIMFTEQATAKDLSLFLENNGIIVPFMNYPVVTGSSPLKTCRFRIMNSSKVVGRKPKTFCIV